MLNYDMEKIRKITIIYIKKGLSSHMSTCQPHNLSQLNQDDFRAKKKKKQTKNIIKSKFLKDKMTRDEMHLQKPFHDSLNNFGYKCYKNPSMIA